MFSHPIGSWVRRIAFALVLAGVLLGSALSSRADDASPDRVERRKTAEKSEAHRSLQDGAAPAVTQKGVATQVRARDGQSLMIGPVLYRLWGIAAPRMDEFGGYSSMQGLSTLIDEATVVCTPSGRSLDGIAVARCKVNGQDLSAAMVAHGWARDCPRQSAGTYAELERRIVVDVAGGFQVPPECQADN